MGLRFEGKSVVVTGAAAGMGYRIAYDFAKEGACVVAADINQNGLDALAEAAEELPGKIVVCHGDLTLQEFSEAMIDHAVERNGKLDILVNNAGICSRSEPVGEETNELWDKVIKTDLYAPMYSTRKAVNVMLKQESRGNIIMIGSVEAFRSAGAGVSYVVAKHGLLGLVESTAWMYGDKGIRCNMICPGYVKTQMVESSSEDSAYGRERIAAGLPKFTDNFKSVPEDIANAVLFLADDASKQINGAKLVVDGGISIV